MLPFLAFLACTGDTDTDLEPGANHRGIARRADG